MPIYRLSIPLYIDSLYPLYRLSIPWHGVKASRGCADATDGRQQRTHLVLGFLELPRRHRVRDDPSRRLHARHAPGDDARADGNREVHASVAGRDVAHRAAVRTAALGLELVDDLH